MSAAGTDPPLVAVVWDPRGFSVFEVAAAAAGVASLAFVVGIGGGEPDPVAHRLLGRKGTLVDAAGRTPDEVADELRRLGVAGLVCYIDAVLAQTADLADRLGLPYHSVRTAAQLTDKLLQREALAAAGVPAPGFAAVPPGPPDAGVLAGLASGIGFPLMVKPRRGAGSRMVSRVDSLDELVDRLAGYGDEEVMLEGYLPSTAPAGSPASDVVSVETVVNGDTLCHVSTTGRFAFAEPFREAGMFTPAALAPETNKAVQQAAGDAIRALGVTGGICHTEIKVTPDGPRVVEVNGRIGNRVPTMLGLLDGPPLLRISLELALGREVAVEPLSASRVAYYFWAYPPVEARRLTGLSGIDRVQDIDGVLEVRQNLPLGATTDWRVGALGHLYAVDGIAADHEQLWAVRRRILDTVEAEFETE